MAEITRDIAMKLWQKCFGSTKFGKDCFGTWICKDGWGNEPYMTIMPGSDGKKYDYSWNVDHIRPKSAFRNEEDADFWENLEPMHRLNNEEKADKYPGFSIEGRKYTVVRDDDCNGYGIVDENNRRIDHKV